jgi:valyl-tRNA synthetase
VELASKYTPAAVEAKWYQYWLDNKYFKSEPDSREPYTIVIPPPNVTGVLHMGHMLNNTIQDILVRRARMLGKNACWVPGTDHASIATEAKVVDKLARKGIRKTDLTREKFLEYAWEWKEEHGGIILQQLRKLGASCDWDRTSFTMDGIRSESVVKVFVDLYRKGLIYRGVRMVNWDPQALTAVSDEEVIYREEHSKLFFLRYRVESEDNRYIVVATTRPETILGDTAVCVHPNDPRYAFLKGKKVIVPLVNRSVPVIMDEYVEMEFGTGCLKVTPAHDVNDYMLGEKYHLPAIDIFNDNGTISDAGELYVDQDRFEVRRQIAIDLETAGLMEKIEDYENKVGYSERTNAVIEPKLSMQWFLKMTDIARPALDAVMDNEVKFYPVKFKNIYRHWMENIKDWCISRQLWWGHRIPAYYLPEGGFVVAATPEEALEEAKKQSGNSELNMSDLQQDEDCLDTWFSSWLWPISLFDGINHPNNREIKYYYPTNDLVTAPDIIFFWVARMIMAGYEYEEKKPFRNVYFTGIVRDKIGRKMSKSLGNSPDPLGLIDKYGADGVRMGLMLAAPAGNDILFDEALCEQGRNFNNKIWNAFRLVKGWTVDDEIPQPESADIAIHWFEHFLHKTMEEVNDSFDKYRISEALMLVYKLFWDEFSSWYLEMIKPGYQQAIDARTYHATLGFFEALLKLLHPFMPFITEELWQALEERKPGESLMIALLPEVKAYDSALLDNFELAKEIISGIRAIRSQKNIPVKEPLVLEIVGDSDEYFYPNIAKMSSLSDIRRVNEKLPGAISFLVGTTEYAVPLGNSMNVVEELAKLQEELKYQQGFLVSVLKKLGNESFVGKAPAHVIDMERKKQADAESKIKMIQESMAALQT